MRPVRDTCSWDLLTVSVSVFEAMSLDMTSLMMRWFWLNECVVELGATRTAPVTCEQEEACKVGGS